MLRESDLYLPKQGWGRIVLAASASRAGTAWTDHGTSRQERGPESTAPPARPAPSPSPPELVHLLRAHIKKYGTTSDGRVFQTTRAASSRTPPTAPSGPRPARRPSPRRSTGSPLGRRPYDLRHAAVSLWLNSGVPATEVARRAGHGVAGTAQDLRALHRRAG